ncbi:unnamed protein product [Vitrella brassicaformis CCMP3155]|uniref:Uncharacterized protein n=1 Tax=Vitrella brassicaformis (strain CCMP3155) TaxID=1169540 RepID=A0A0G4ETW2_VITBC|nr:unnamed protein product [Vitrella brassicaformis CCMP3155]|eukprot:CEM01819.1 unnamed protein product [Vitrella brassicaformis CCMP3155]
MTKRKRGKAEGAFGDNGLQDDAASTEKVGEIMVHNTSAAALTGCVLDLDKVALSFVNSYYNPADNPSRVHVRVEYRDPFSIVEMYENGRLKLTSAPSIDAARLNLRRAARRLKVHLGYDVKFHNFQICGLMATYYTGFEININKLTKDTTFPIKYDLERSPGAQVMVPVPDEIKGPDDQQKDANITVTVFHSGKTSVLGAKSLRVLEYVYARLLPLLETFKYQPRRD